MKTIEDQKSILNLIKESVRKNPDHTALVFKDQRFTYAELEERTDCLAAYLQSQGIGRGSVVSILIPRNEYMLITSLGVLKTGAAYQPLDASYPYERIQYMIQDAASSMIITSKEMENLLFDIEVPRYYIEDIAFLTSEVKYELPCICAEDLFVLLYTSGSTGVPKGCMIQHGNIVSFCQWYLSYYQVDETCRMGEHASFVFDVSMMELFMPLAGGAQVHILPEEIRTDLHRLNQYFEENQITHSSITTQLGRQFAAHMENHSLRHLTVAGEALVPIKPPKNYQLHNGYGPTEGTILLTIQPVREYYPENVPIGSPLDEVEIYVLDQQGKQVENGEMGELCAAGPHITLGYLNQQEQTEKVYTPNPFSSAPGYERIYHTGDLVRYREDGLLEYLGRADRQVKIRGFRIELPEVEAVMREYPDVTDATVSTIEIHGEKYLVGYYVSVSEISSEQWSQFISRKKPSYLIPTYYVHLDHIPLNTNGKVDSSRLPLPDVSIGQIPYSEPQSEIEEAVASLYARILEIDQVGREDNFLFLGGHSLLATKLLFCLEQEFQCSLTIRDVMQYPIVKELSARIETVLMEQGKEGGYQFLSKMQPLDMQSYYPAGKAQKRIYTAQQLCHPGDRSYYMPVMLRVAGRIEEERIKKVLGEQLKRHESLRTSFGMEQGEIVQRIEAPSEDWIWEAVERTHCNDIANIEMELDIAPLFRWNVQYDAEMQETLIQWNWHHIISDGSSISLFCDEFIRLYHREKLEPIAIQYKEYAMWEQKQASSIQVEKQKQAWLQKLEGEIPILDIKTDYPLRGEGLHRGKIYPVDLSKELSERIHAFCQKKGITDYMFLLSVYFILLHKYSRQERMVVGTVMDGRVQSATENIQGMFVNTVPLLGQVKDTDSFHDIVQKIKEMILFAYEYQEYSLEDIAAELKTERTPSGNLLFDVLFVMQSFERNLPPLEEGRTILEFVPTDTAMYPLTLEAEEMDGRFHFDFEYDKDLFVEKTIEAMAVHYQNLLEECLKDPSATIGNISMLDASERKFLLEDVQGKEQKLSGETVVEMLRRQSEVNPKKKAVVFGGEVMDYETLERESGRLASAMNGCLEREDFVVVFAERGFEMILGIWGVLQAGGAYVPVSPEYPAERISYIIQDCCPCVVMTCGAVLPKECEETIEKNGILIVDIRYDGKNRELEWQGIDGWQEERKLYKAGKSIHVKPEQLAYMIYTSGTTGEPKGVMVEHRQLANLLEVYTGIYQLTERDCVLQFANFVFDQSVWDIFHILTVGGTLCLIPSDIVKNPDRLERYCEEQGVTVASLTPGYLRVLHPDHLPSLRLLDVGGEAPSQDLLMEWAEGRTVLNTYGPTETTVNATSFVYDRGDWNNVPIGKAIPNTQVYILQGNELCGVGVPGELCIAGAGVTRGYWHREALTEEKYVPNPFGTGKMYRSGDLARYLQDGNIEFLGRFDEQVKIRGYRIELGEIEAAMCGVPEVHSAVVVVKKDAHGDKQLCAYYTLQGSLETKTLRQILADKLPYYMVPSNLMELQEMPLTVNGKLNKRALPEPQWSAVEHFCEPESREEQICVEAWEKVLQVSPIGVLDDFFELGGDSIKAIMIVSLLQENGYQIEVQEILKDHSIRRIASHMKKSVERQEYQEYSQVMLTPVIKDFFAANMPYPNYYNQSVMLHFSERVDLKALENAVNGLVQYHGMLRMKLDKGNAARGDKRAGSFAGKKSAGTEGKVQIYLQNPEDVAGISISVYEGLSKEERMSKCNILQNSLCPENGTVMNACLFRDADNDDMLIVLHHLVVDEVSWNILLEDLSTLYAAAQTGKKELLSVLPEHTISFGEWSEKLYQFAESSDFMMEKAYWKQKMDMIDKGALATKEWLCRYRSISGAMTEPEFQYLYQLLGKSTSQKLMQLAEKRYHARMDALLLAGLIHTICQTEQIEHLTIQLESHGRGNVGDFVSCSRTVGWFTAVYPFSIEYKKDWDEQIIWIKENLLRVPNAGIGYGLIQDHACGEEGVIYNYLGQSQSRDFGAFTWSEKEVGQEIHPENGERGTISFNIRMQERGLEMECCFDGCYSIEKMNRLFIEYCEQLRALALMKSSEEQVVSPSELCIGKVMGDQEWSLLCKENSISEIEAVSSLTPLQQGMFYHWLAEKQNKSYVIQDQVTIYGEWQEESMQNALLLLAQKYDALRMGFVYQGFSQPWQILWKQRKPVLKVLKEGGIADYAEKELEKGFDLVEDTLIRILAFPESEDRTELLITQHHIIMDGWSFSILLRDLERYYLLLCAGESMQNMEMMVLQESQRMCCFTDYLRWNTDRKCRDGFTRWKEYLKDYSESIGIRRDLPEKREAVRYGHRAVGHCTRILRGELQEKAELFVREQHVTMSVLFEALWGMILQMENNVQDVVFGKTVSGRNIELKGAGDTVGLLINTVPVRVKTRKEQSVTNLLQDMQNSMVQMMPYGHIALSDIQNQTSLGSGLIQTLYVYENYPVEEKEELHFKAQSLHEETNYPLTFYVEEKECLELNILYDVDHYSPEYMTLLLCRMEHILVQILENPSGKVKDLERITMSEREDMLGNLSGISVKYPQKTILDLFVEQVNTYPDKVAVVIEKQSLTYRELYIASGLLAKKIGYGEERFVAILAERSLEMIVGILGTLMSGAAYVPIDPSYPTERMEYILEDCKPRCILEYLPTVSFHVQELAQKKGIPSMAIVIERQSDAEPDCCFEEEQKRLTTEVLWNRAAYMIYTSGTTGNPKGVVIEHKSLSNMIFANTDYYGFSQADIVLQLANYVFDQSVWDIFNTIGVGATLCLIPKENMSSAESIERYCREHMVTVLMTTTVMLGALHPEKMGKLRLVDGGGDAARETIFQAWEPYADRVVNSYGPTEITVNATAYTFDSTRGGNIPIGKALFNKKIYIMQDNYLCGIGQAGEICIAGEGLAREYLHQEILTKERFVENPFGKGRMYRTGDLGRYLPDGNISYLGRMDEQVKIRGFRIELGEIEQRLREMPEIDEAAVICSQEGAERNYLVAYLVSNQSLEEKEVKKYLQQKLPEYMIPSFVQFMDALPLNQSGKLDVRKLEKIDFKQDMEYEEPNDFFEKKVATLYQEILGVRKVGRNESFFELGGTSIDVMKLVSGLAEYSVEVADVFAYSTVSSLGEYIRKGWNGENVQRDSFVLLQKGNSDLPSLICLPPSSGMTICYLELIQELTYPGNVYGMSDSKYRLFWKLPLETLQNRKSDYADLWNQTIDSYWQEICKIWKDGDVLVGYSQGGSVAHELAKRLEQQGHKVGMVIMLESAPMSGESVMKKPRGISYEEEITAVHQIFSEIYGEEGRCVLDNGIDHKPVDEYKRMLVTYLVIQANVLHPLHVEGKIHAPIYSIEIEENGDGLPRKVGACKKLWQIYSDAQGEAFAVKAKEEEHLVFLSRYKKEIAEFMGRVL